MNISIREHIKKNFKDSSIQDLEDSIKESVNSKDEVVLPGLGVLFEILWKNSNNTDEILNVIDLPLPLVNDLRITKNKRDPKKGANAKKRAKYLCEVDGNHKTFKGQNGENYCEAHHLIPMNMQEKFFYSLDVEANIVSLCPTCHNLLHYSINNIEKKNIIISMAIAGALAGLGGCLYYLNPGIEYCYASQYSKLPDYGFNGIASAFLANCNPIGIIFSSIFIRYINIGGDFLNKYNYNRYVADIIIGVIIYLAGFTSLIRGLLNKKRRPKPNKNITNVNTNDVIKEAKSE